MLSVPRQPSPITQGPGRAKLHRRRRKIDEEYKKFPVMPFAFNQTAKMSFSLNLSAKFRAALDKYTSAFKEDIEKYATGKVPLSLPVMETDLLMALFERVQQIFKEEPTLLDIRSPCIVVGDIHGQILDLFRILRFFGMPTNKKYVFLGDIVDRGEFSIETLIIVYLLKVLWPDNVFVIRGNHEFQDLCSQGEGNFLNQVINFFEDYSIYQAAARSFEYIPLAMRIDKCMLCVHGGIGPSLRDLNSIRMIQRPIDSFGSDSLDSLVWSDPSDDVELYENSSRGTGYIFGAKACETFMKTSGLTMIIRGHECVDEGCESHFDNKLMTVFSASNYCGVVNNKAGVLEITNATTYKARTFPPLPWLLRGEVIFTGGKVRQDPLAALRARKVRESESSSNMPTLKPGVKKSPRGLNKEASTSVKELPRLTLIGDTAQKIKREPTARAATNQRRRRSLY